MKRVIFLLFISISYISLPALSATLSIEGYSYTFLTKNLSDISHNIDIYSNGEKIISDKQCTNKEPCKIEIPKKTILTLCSALFEKVCQTNIRFDPAESPLQRYAFVFTATTFYVHYTVYRPEEMAVLDGFLAKQTEAEKQMDEIKKRVQY